MAATASFPNMGKASIEVGKIFSALSSSEARYFDEERFSEAELRSGLSDSLTDRKVDAMKRLLAHVAVGRDGSSLFPDVVKNVSFHSLELKKLIYIYLVQYAENNRDLALLSINSFQKDLSDRSQLVRASALRAMASIKVLEVIQLVMVAVKTASVDSSPYVRKTAAQCMTKVYAVDPDQFLELRKLLLKMMNDHEVQVVGSAVMAFHHICVARPPRTPSAVDPGGPAADAPEVPGAPAGSEDGLRTQLALLHPHFRRLCQDILVMEPWAQQCCVDLLLRYCRVFFALPPREPGAAAGPEAGEAAEGRPAVSKDFGGLFKSLRLLLSSSSKGVTLAAVVALCYLAPCEELKAVTFPLLRCLRQAPAESVHSLLTAFMPVVEAVPELLRTHVREFFVQSFDYQGVKKMKLKLLEHLVDETNVQLILREFQTYVCWQSHPEFVALAVQSIAHIALKISSVADSCLRGLVKMLDSKCEVLSCEAVVSLRALLQQRQQNADSNLGTVLPHLACYLEDLAAPTARASVIWILGQYQREAPRLAPDVLRRLAKTFATERQEVKQQILGLSLKVWAFHALNTKGQVPAQLCRAEASGGAGAAGATARQPPVEAAESARILPRLEAIVDHIGHLASYDGAWDVRDTARALIRLKAAAKAGMAAGAEAGRLEALGVWYGNVCVTGKSPVEGTSTGAEDSSASNVGASEVPRAGFDGTWILGSLAQALDFPLETYRALPGWSTENSSDELREPQVEARPPPPARSVVGISSADEGAHMARTQQPTNIAPPPPLTSNLADLDLFYSADTAPRRPAPPMTAAPLEQMRFGGAGGPAPVGTAVYGEDDESDSDEESADEPDDDYSDWKYCLQASQQAPANASPASPASVRPSSDGPANVGRGSLSSAPEGSKPAAADASPIAPTRVGQSFAAPADISRNVLPEESKQAAEGASPAAPTRVGQSFATPAAISRESPSSAASASKQAAESASGVEPTRVGQTFAAPADIGRESPSSAQEASEQAAASASTVAPTKVEQSPAAPADICRESPSPAPAASKAPAGIGRESASPAPTASKQAAESASAVAPTRVERSLAAPAGIGRGPPQSAPAGGGVPASTGQLFEPPPRAAPVGGDTTTPEESNTLAANMEASARVLGPSGEAGQEGGQGLVAAAATSGAPPATEPRCSGQERAAAATAQGVVRLPDDLLG